MEILSKMADYAVSVMVVMAMSPTRPHSAQSLAERASLPRPTVGNLLKKLAAAGLLTSEFGPRGGYRLARPGSEISVLAIITAIDGQIGFTECGNSQEDALNCARAGFCTTKPHWQTMTRAVNQALAQVSLADMSPPPGFISDFEKKAIVVRGERKKKDHYEVLS